MKNKSQSIRVPLKEADKIHKYLSGKKLLRNDLKIRKDSIFIYFPVKNIPEELSGYYTEKSEFEKRNSNPRSYKEIISIPDNLKNKLPTSFDVIGDIILLKIDRNLIDYKKEIGDSLLEVNKNIKTVCLVEPVSGEFRTRNIEIISGENRLTTTHVEYGLEFNMDVKNTYFSPRLANERKRITKIVENNEIIVDMFSGVGPFSIMIAKYANPKIVYAIDKNKIAIKYAKQNIRKNNVLDKIEVINADAKDIHKILKNKADRIIMNLPFSSHLFLEHALNIAKNKCIIHYYDILNEDKIPNRIDEISSIGKENGYLLNYFQLRKIKTYGPREFYIGIDIMAKKMPM